HRGRRDRGDGGRRGVRARPSPRSAQAHRGRDPADLRPMASDDSPRVAAIRRLATERGLLDGKRGWAAVAAVTWGIRGLQPAMRRDEVVAIDALEPGEQIVISHHLPTSGRKARRAEEELAKKRAMAASLTRRERKRAVALDKQRRSAERSGQVRKARKLAAKT